VVNLSILRIWIYVTRHTKLYHVMAQLGVTFKHILYRRILKKNFKHRF